MYKLVFKGFSFLFFIALILSIGACNNRSIMFKTGAQYNYADMSQMAVAEQYKIGVNDELVITVTPNKGANLVEGESQLRSSIGGIISIVEFDGSIKIPVLGPITIAGLTNREAELLLEERYRAYFVDPFVKIKINNKRVILFPGESGSARVVILKNENTTLLEAIAGAGGIPTNGKANKVKLIRKDDAGVLNVYLIDLSHISGLYSANTVLQGNDIVYVEPRNDYLMNFASRATGYFFVLNTLLLLNNLLK